MPRRSKRIKDEPLAQRPLEIDGNGVAKLAIERGRAHDLQCRSERVVRSEQAIDPGDGCLKILARLSRSRHQGIDEFDDA